MFQLHIIICFQIFYISVYLCILQGAGTDETVLVEIMTSRTNEELDEIKEIYEKGIST